MRILLASSSISENGNGISSYGIDFLKLLSINNECYVIAGDTIDEKNKPFVKDSYLFSSIDLSSKNLLKFLDIIKVIKPDVIVNSNFRIMSLAIPFIDSRVYKVSISHFVDGELAVVAGYNHRFYNKIIALSNEGKMFLERYYKIKDGNKVKVIYNFYFGGNINKLKKNNSPLVITFPGGSSSHKNPKLVFSILKKLQKTMLPFKFYWLGDTKIAGNRFFNMGEIKDLFLNDERIIFTNRIPRNEATRIIQNSNIFLLPSKKEGCPISLLEAISVGTIPLISDSRHASSELITHMETGFVLPEDNFKPYVKIISNIINNHREYFQIYVNTKKLHELKLSETKWKNEMDNFFRIENNKIGVIEIKYNIYKKIRDKSIFNSLLLIERLKQVVESLSLFAFFLKGKFRFYNKRI